MKRTRPQLIHSGSDKRVTEDDLQAYVDGQVDGRRRAAVEAYLADRPDEAARLADYRAQNIGLHALFDPPSEDGPGDGPLPPRIAALAGALDAQRRAARPHGTPRAGQPRRLRRLAASVVVLLTAGAAGWIALEQVSWRDDALVALTRQASQAPFQTVATPTPASTAAPDTQRQVVGWLASLPGDVPTTVPDLENLGFSLVSEQLLPNAGGAPMAQLLYRDEDGQRVTLTMRTGGKAGKTSFTFTREGDESRFVWQDAHMAYSLIGSMPQEKLLQIAEAISAGLRNEGPAAAPQEAAKAPDSSPDSIEAGTAPAAPPAGGPDPAPPAVGSEPLLDESPLIPVPLPEADAPKET